MTTRTPIIDELRRTRIARGFTQAEIGRIAGFERRTLMKWEAEKRTPSWPALEAWAASLGLQLGLQSIGRRQ